MQDRFEEVRSIFDSSFKSDEVKLTMLREMKTQVGKEIGVRMKLIRCIDARIQLLAGLKEVKKPHAKNFNQYAED